MTPPLTRQQARRLVQKTQQVWLAIAGQEFIPLSDETLEWLRFTLADTAAIVEGVQRERARSEVESSKRQAEFMERQSAVRHGLQTPNRS